MQFRSFPIAAPRSRRWLEFLAFQGDQLAGRLVILEDFDLRIDAEIDNGLFAKGPIRIR
jgi:hypothetical protein